MNIQGWFPLGFWLVLSPLQSKGLKNHLSEPQCESIIQSVKLNDLNLRWKEVNVILGLCVLILEENDCQLYWSPVISIYDS